MAGWAKILEISSPTKSVPIHSYRLWRVLAVIIANILLVICQCCAVIDWSVVRLIMVPYSLKLTTFAVINKWSYQCLRSKLICVM